MSTIEEAVRQIMAARPSFKVGDRVRVTASIAECRALPQPGSNLDKIDGQGHLESECGVIGRVMPWSMGSERTRLMCEGDGHTVLVLFDSPVRVGARWCNGNSYAPTELELLDAAGAPADEGAC